MMRSAIITTKLALGGIFTLGLAVLGGCQQGQDKSGARLRFSISFPQERSRTPLDGRVLLMVSKDGTAEPRFQISDDADTQQVFGIDVVGLKAGEAAVIDGQVFGYPRASIAGIPPGEYYVQALLQYNDRADVWSTNLRLGWLQSANTGLFVVFNDTQLIDDRLTRAVGRSVIVKYSHMFDLLR